MPDPLITLTTDFGDASPYVAAMKGVILGVEPAARIIDLTHRVPAQDVRYADYFLAATLPYFPGGCLHVVVVDPGVGTARRLLYVEVGGLRLLAPDNGCWTSLACRVALPPRVHQLSDDRFWRQPVSRTFHGRDILAPVAGYLSRGLDPGQLGPPVYDWLQLDLREPTHDAVTGELRGEVVFVDCFGNLITNLPADDWKTRAPQVRVEAQAVPRWVGTYGEAEPGSLVALVSSGGTVEIAVVQGNAAARLRAGLGTQVAVRVPGSE